MIGGIRLFTDWFQENSFHMQLFFFASGYFYKIENEQNIKGYIVKKIKKLLIPCLLYNLFYGMINTLLYKIGFSIGEKFNLFDWLLSPFMFGSNFKFNSPDWFIAQLFIVEVINVLIRKLLCDRAKRNGQIISFLFIFLGVLVTCFGWNGELSALVKILFRTIFCLSWYAIGILYKKYEVYDKLNNYVYFVAVFSMQLMLLVYNKGNVSGSVVGFSFGIEPWQVYMTALLGIAFWLRLCKIIASGMKDNRVISYIGRHTFSIVENQYLGIFILNTILLFINRKVENGIGFVEEYYFTRHNYIFIYRDIMNFPILYLVFGITVPLAISLCGERCREKFLVNFGEKIYGKRKN